MKTIKTISDLVWAWMNAPQVNENEISFFDVKALYDAAYEEKDGARASLRRFRTLMDRAQKLEAAYRAQLNAARTPFLTGKAA